MESRIIDFRRHRTFMDTITAIFEFMGSAIKPYFTAVTVIAGPYILVAAISNGVNTMRSIDFSTFDASNFDLAEFFLPMLIMYAATIVAGMVTLATTLSFIRISQREERYPSVAEVREDMRGMLGKVIGTSFLVILILIPAILFFLIPGIWMAVPLSLTVVIRYNEERSFSEAVTRAFRLVREHWWWTLGVLLLCAMAQAIATSVFSIPTMILTMMSTLTVVEGTEPSMTMQVATGIMSAVSNLAGFYFSTIVTVATAAIYYNHVERVDATQLSDRVASLTGSAQD